jgi:hypothetical protein
MSRLFELKAIIQNEWRTYNDVDAPFGVRPLLSHLPYMLPQALACVVERTLKGATTFLANN